MNAPVWALLAFAAWTIAILTFGIGVTRWSLILSGKAQLNGFPGDEPHGSPLYRRVTRAHANCVENLPVFGAIVVAGQAYAVSSPVYCILSIVIVCARVGQTVAHVSSGSNSAVGVRFSFLPIQLVGFVWMITLIVQHATQK
jgi:uncharacterized MAPEG superfamily protein